MASRFWIAFGDIHERVAALDTIDNLAGASAVLLTGDLTNIGTREKTERVLSAVSGINPHLYAQIGNMDTQAVSAVLDERNCNVHCRVTDLGGGVGLAAVGCSTPTPFGTPSEVDEDTISGWVGQVLQDAAGFAQVILMVHTPPRGEVVDRLPMGAHVGSPGIRALIEKYQPCVVLTGHIHEARGEEWIGRSHVLNPGDFAGGGYVHIAETPDGLRASLRGNA